MNMISVINIMNEAGARVVENKSVSIGLVPLVHAWPPCPYLVQFWLNYTKSPKHTQNQALG